MIAASATLGALSGLETEGYPCGSCFARRRDSTDSGRIAAFRQYWFLPCASGDRLRWPSALETRRGCQPELRSESSEAPALSRAGTRKRERRTLALESGRLLERFMVGGPRAGSPAQAIAAKANIRSVWV